jgi:hypothetical protein
MKHTVFAVAYSDNFAALANDELTTNYSSCIGVYTSHEKALAAAKAEATAFQAGKVCKIRRKPPSKLDAEDIEVFQAVFVAEGPNGEIFEEVEASFHVSAHELELDEPKRARETQSKKRHSHSARGSRPKPSPQPRAKRGGGGER